MDTFVSQAQKMREMLFDTMRTLHRHPELSFKEFETTKLIRKTLESLGLELIDLGMPTGAVALLRGEKQTAGPRPLVALRADIDAIAETECSPAQVTSQVPGVFHGCGHDLHTTCLLGAAALLSKEKALLAGDVAFIFQPAEEVTQGAATMLENGLMQCLPAVPRGLFGLHSWPMLKGEIGVRQDVVAAGKTNFRITLTGKSGQGGFPHECIDVVVAGAALVEGVQTIVSRNSDPRKPLVCAVYTLQAGTHEFFVTDTAVLTGSIRALDKGSMAMAQQRLEELTRSIAAGYGCKHQLELMPQVPPLENAPQLVGIARQAAASVVGPGAVTQPPPMLGSDDFAVFGEKMPVFYYQLGAMPPEGEIIPLHRPDFGVDYEAIPLGAALLAESAWCALENWQSGSAPA